MQDSGETLDAALAAAHRHIAEGRSEQGEAILIEWAARAPGDARLLFLRGLAARHSGRMEDAVEYFREAVRIEPSEPAIHYRLGVALTHLRQLRLAEGALMRAVALDPANAEYAVVAAQVTHGLDPASRSASLLIRDSQMRHQRYQPPQDCQIAPLAELYGEVFGFKTEGTFVEIGAYDGQTCSNTCFLADLGWQGLYVEPVRAHAEACRLRHGHNRVRVVEAGIGPQPGTATISVAGVLSSMAGHHVAAFENQSWGKGVHRGETQTVLVITPAMVFGLLPSAAFDILVIDVEGLEEPIVAAIDFDHWRPVMIIIEVRDADPSFPEAIRQESARAIARIVHAGYRPRWRDEGNVVLVRDV